MKIRTRLILSFTLLIVISFYFLTRWILNELTPRYLESMEEVLVDETFMLAGMVERQLTTTHIDVDLLRNLFDHSKQKTFKAKIYNLSKTNTDQRIYITDNTGTVLMDSMHIDEGKNYITWNNIWRTLNGQYGARSSREPQFFPNASVIHVTAPIHFGDAIIGTLTVAKPTNNIIFFIEAVQPQFIIVGIVAGLCVILLGILFSTWITRPIKQLRDYALSVGEGNDTQMPFLGKSEIGDLGMAFDKMKKKLEGKKYVERYLQTLTHELKSPLASIRGSVELLGETLNKDDQSQFIKNIAAETERIHLLIQKLLNLASLQNMTRLETSEIIDVSDMITTSLKSLEPMAARQNIRLITNIQCRSKLRGDLILLQQALINITSNALDFSPRGSSIYISANEIGQNLTLTVEDEGPGIPDYAQNRIFENFYSLPRPNTGNKSTGLGLNFVREIMKLHQGEIRLENRSPQGVRVTLIIPIH